MYGWTGWQLLGVIGTSLLCLLLMAVVYVMYSGLFFKINIQTGSPPMRNITIAYKYKQGPYKDCGPLFAECSKLGPKLNTIGVFYDDPKKVAGPLCRYAVGSILCEAGDSPCEETQLRYQACGFRLCSFPEVTHAVCSSFPHRTPLSVFLGVQRVYPLLTAHIKQRQLCAHPFLEVYGGRVIHYMSPLSRQDGFYVPEVRDYECRRSGEEEEEEDEDEDDGVTIFSGSGSYSQRSSVSGQCRSSSQRSSVSGRCRSSSQRSSVSGRCRSESQCSSVIGGQRSSSQLSYVIGQNHSGSHCTTANGQLRLRPNSQGSSVIGRRHSRSPYDSVTGQNCENSHHHPHHHSPPQGSPSLCPVSSVPLSNEGGEASGGVGLVVETGSRTRTRTRTRTRSPPSTTFTELDLEMKLNACSSAQKELLPERGMAAEGEE